MSDLEVALQQKQDAEQDEKTALIEIEGAVLSLVQYVTAQDAEKRSFQYWVEECLVKGADVINRRRDVAETRNNRAAFDKALTKDPTIVTDPARMQALLSKFKIGASK